MRWGPKAERWTAEREERVEGREVDRGRWIADRVSGRHPPSPVMNTKGRPTMC